jgi:hypothetical protein
MAARAFALRVDPITSVVLMAGTRFRAGTCGFEGADVVVGWSNDEGKRRRWIEVEREVALAHLPLPTLANEDEHARERSGSSINVVR